MNVRAAIIGCVGLFVSLGGDSTTWAEHTLSLEGLSLTPLSHVAPGGMLALQATVSNTGDSVQRSAIVVTLEGFPNLQSARRIVLAAGQREQFDLFVPIPVAARNQKSLNIVATMMDRQGGREVIVEHKGTPARQMLTVEVGTGRTLGLELHAGAPQLPAWYWPTAAPRTDYEAVMAARVSARYDRSAASFEDRLLPMNDSAWAALDLLVISNPATLEDAAVVETLRRYVSSGGRLWIMVDLVPCTLVRPLLGPTQMCEEISRIELNDFVVEPVGLMNKISEQDRRVMSDTDLTMVRVVQAGGRVRFNVDGWPAAIDMNIDYGQILLTTLDSLAWIEPRTTQPSQDVRFQSAYQPRAWANAFAIDANAARPMRPLSEPVEYPLKQIGNTVVPRPWVTTVLFACFVSLGMVGWWLASTGKLAYIGIVTPALAIATSLALVAMASWTRRDMPDTLSRFQIVEVSSDGNLASVREQSAVFLRTSASMQLDGNQDAFVGPGEALSGGVTRWTQDDFQQWNLSNENWPPGTWRYATDFSTNANQLVVHGSLSQAGLHLHMPEPIPSPLEDPVLSFAAGSPMLCRSSSGGFDVVNRTRVAADRWILGTFLSDQQQWRLDVYRQFFQANSQRTFPARRLYGWTQPWDGAKWNRELAQRGSALVSLPVLLDRPAIGTEVFIPHGLITLQRNMSSQTITTTFDDRSGEWRKDVSAAAEADMQLLLPEEVVPLAASAIELELAIWAPQRTVSVTARTPAGDIELVQLDSPSLPWTATISNANVLEDARDGVINVLIKVSASRDTDSSGIASNMIRWQIDHFHANVRGTVQAKSAFSSTDQTTNSKQLP